MRIYPALILLSFILIISSCKNDDLDEQVIPPALLGLWEATYYNDYLDMDYVTAYTFNQNGTYVYSSILREKGEDQDLGYNFRISGNFRVEGNNIFLEMTERLYKPYYADKLLYQIDELDREYLVEGQSQGSMNFEVRNEGHELFLPGGLIGGAYQADQILVRVNYN